MMLGDLNKFFCDSGGLGMLREQDPLQLMNSRPDLHAGWQAQQSAGIRNCVNDIDSWKRLVGLADANAEKRLAEEAKKYTRLEF